MDEREKIIAALSISLKSAGFKKNKNNFFLQKTDIVILINLQKSNFDSDLLYINFGVFYRGLNNSIESKKIKVYDAHFEGRYETILYPEQTELSFEENHDFDKRLQKISFNITSIIIPFLNKFSDASFVKQFLNSDELYKNMQLQNIEREKLLSFIDANFS